jgi:hypothetical protein
MWQLLDSSSRVHFRSAPIILPEHAHGMSFPKRSAPWLFTTAPLGGLMPPPARRHRWTDYTFVVLTISITACSEIYIHCFSAHYGIVREYEAICYHLHPDFFYVSHKRPQTTETRMNYTMCWRFVALFIKFIVIFFLQTFHIKWTDHTIA